MSEAVRAGLSDINFYRDLKRYARALTKNSAAADDLTSAAIEKALLNAADFEAGTNLRAWTKSIMFGLYRNDRRRGVRREYYEKPREDEDFPIAAVQDLRMEVDDVHRAIAALPVDQRATIFLIVYEELSYEAAAKQLGVEIGTVKSRVNRARETLKVTLEAKPTGIGRADAAALLK